MYPLGHVALGYFAGYIVSRVTGEGFSVPLIWVVALSPDVDFFIPFLVHRGPTHSLVVALVLFSIYYALFRRGVPYFGALVSHSLIGDYFTSYGCKLFWPVFPGWYRSSVAISYAGHFGMGVEIILFMFMLLLLARNYIARTNNFTSSLLHTLCTPFYVLFSHDNYHGF